MAGIKRKVDRENRHFNTSWELEYFFTLPDINAKPQCVICLEKVSVMKRSNVKRHFETKHLHFNEIYPLGSFERQKKFDQLKSAFVLELEYINPLSFVKEQTPEPDFLPQGSPSSTSPVPIAPKKAAPPPPPPPQPSQPPEVCLRWNSYHSNMQATFPSLLNNEQFVDVTLACEGRSIKCHKVMLSACSSYFEELLSQNPCQHPIVFMRDLKFWEVQALVEFMYSGEVNVAQEKLPSLLAAAEALQIKGLTPSTASSSNHEDDPNGGGGDTDESSHPQPQKRVRKRKSAHPVPYPVRLQNTPPSPSPSGNQISQMPMQTLQKIKVPMMSPLPGTSHHREDPTSYHPPVRIKRERSSTPPLALSLKEEPLDLGIDSSERNKDDNGQAHNTTLQDAINRLHGKQQHHSIGQAPGLIKMESNGGLSEDDGSGSERSPAAQTDPGEGVV